MRCFSDYQRCCCINCRSFRIQQHGSLLGPTGERLHHTSFIQTLLAASSLPDRIQTACTSVSGCSPSRSSLSYVTGDTICSTGPTRSLGSAAHRSLTILRYNLERYGRRAYSVAGPSLWNNLPLTIAKYTSLCYSRWTDIFVKVTFKCNFNDCTVVVLFN